MDPLPQNIQALTASVDRLATGMQALFAGLKALQDRISNVEERLNVIEYRYPPAPTLVFADENGKGVYACSGAVPDEQKVTLGCNCPFSRRPS